MPTTSRRRMVGADQGWLLGRRASDLATFDREVARDRVARLGDGEAYTGRATGIRADGSTFPADVEVAAVELDGQRRLLAAGPRPDRPGAPPGRAHPGPEDGGHRPARVGRRPRAQQPAGRDPRLQPAHPAPIPALPEDLRHNADLLVEEATRTRRIVQNLLDFARQRPPERHPTSIRALVDSVLALQSYSFGKGRIEVETDIPDDLPLGRAGSRPAPAGPRQPDPQRDLRDAQGGGGRRLRISAAAEGPRDDPRVRVTVMDDGPGVAAGACRPAVRGVLHDQADRRTGRASACPCRTGSSPSHGGELRYGPSAWGRGAAFTFDLPVHATVVDGGPLVLPEPDAAAISDATTADAVAPPASPPVDGDGGRVLVLDDEPASGRSCARPSGRRLRAGRRRHRRGGHRRGA